MLVKSIVIQLKKGSIKNVIPIGEYNKATNPGGMLQPYVLVYESSSINRYTKNGLGESFYKIVAAFPTSYHDQLNKYILYEVFDLLDNKLLYVKNDRGYARVKVSVTDRMSRVITDTSDGYIARERTITVPYRWR